MPVIVPLALTGVKAIIGFITSAAQKKQAAELQAQNPRPVETVPQGVTDATALAKLMASLGMPPEQYNAAINNIRRNQAVAINQAQDARGGLGLVNAIQQQSNDATLNLDAKSAAMKTDNQRALVNQDNQLGEWQDKTWQWNSQQKYLENAAAIRALTTSSKANANSATDSLLSAAATAGTSIAGSVNPNTAGITATSPQGTAGPTDPQTGLYSVPGGSASGATDPTITNPGLFPSGLPSGITAYLKQIMNQQAA